MAISILLHSSTAGAGSVTRDDWVVWLERDAGTPPAAAACVADRAFDTLPPAVLEAAPALGFSGLPGGWRERISASYIACAVKTG
ncbi:MAG: hypothetical protein R2746_15875 [Acidimicrobiales bacterium]|nr:hypothetical protein [Actinomycetota bacterium]